MAVKKPAPTKVDYDKDNVITDKDAVLAQKDTSPKDGVVTPEEERKWNQEQGSTRTVYEYDENNNIISQKVMPVGQVPVEPALSASDLGFSKQFLDAHPDVKDALQRAIENNWDEVQFVNFVETQTDFGKKTTASQAAFAIGISGKDREEWQKRIQENYAALDRQAKLYGISLSESQKQQFATNMVRNELNENDMLALFSKQFAMPGEKRDLVGETSRITDSVSQMAKSYGVLLTDDVLQAKVKQGISQGADWQTWLEGQRNVFRNQAKMLYPKVADRFDDFTMDDLLDPYLSTASQMLGINRQQMNYNDPKTGTMWTAALNGKEGPMSQDEWVNTLRNDRQYGWVDTNAAKREMTDSIGGFLSLFGVE